MFPRSGDTKRCKKSYKIFYLIVNYSKMQRFLTLDQAKRFLLCLLPMDLVTAVFVDHDV